MDPKLRVRQRFSGFYDLTVREGAHSSDIDGANFDANHYVSSMLRSKPLSELVAKSNELSGEIKELDSDMQMLVYENYNKFISATETIQQMKVKVDGMEGEMETLKTSVKDITESSTRINANLEERRLRIQKLNGVRRLLKKLSFIFELPTRLNRAVELDACAEAVKYWCTSLPVLKAYKNVPAFQAVEQEAKEILGKLSQKLQARLDAVDTSPEDLHEAAVLLMQLDYDPSTLRDQYLKIRKDRLSAALRQRQSRGDDIRLGSRNGVLSRHFLDEVKDTALSFQEVFMGPGGADELEAPTGQTAGALSPKPAQRLSGSEELLDQVVIDMTNGYMATLKKEVVKASTDEDSGAVVEQLESWHDAVRSVDALLPNAKVGVAADAIVELCGQSKIAATFESLNKHLVDDVTALSKAASRKSLQSEECKDSVSQSFNSFIGAFGETLNLLKAFMVSETNLMARFRPSFAAIIHRQIIALFESSAEQSMMGVEAHVRERSAFVLLLSSFWLTVKSEGIPKLEESLILKGSGVGPADVQQAQATMGEIQELIQAIITALLTRYVQIRAVKSSRKVSDLVSALGKGDLADSIVDQIMEEINGVVSEVQEILPSQTEEPDQPSDFQNKAEVLEKTLSTLGPHPSTLIRGVIVLILQTLTEKLRLETYTPQMVQKVEGSVERLGDGVRGLGFYGEEVAFLLQMASETASDRSLRG